MENESKPRSLDVQILDKLSKLRKFAHHPSCKYYNHHLVWIFDEPICIGHLFMSLGIISSIGITVIFSLWNQNLILQWIIGFLLFTSAIVQPYFTKMKNLKMLSRFALGNGIILMINLPLFWQLNLIGVIIKITSIPVFFGSMKLTLAYRDRKLDNPCKRCPDGTFPLCKHKHAEIKKIITKYQGNDNLQILPVLEALNDQFDGKVENQIFFESNYMEAFD